MYTLRIDSSWSPRSPPFATPTVMTQGVFTLFLRVRRSYFRCGWARRPPWCEHHKDFATTPGAKIRHARRLPRDGRVCRVALLGRGTTTAGAVLLASIAVSWQRISRK